MPLYEFRCLSCSQEFEALVRWDTSPQCPQCGGVELERLPSAASMSSVERTKANVNSARKALRKSKRDEVEYHKELERDHH